MKTILKIVIFTLMFIFLLGIKGAKALDEYKKVIKKEFQVNADAQLTINNRFGKVHCENWDKNAITVEVTITVDASDQESADKRLNRIAVDFTDSPSLVTATTNMNEGKGRNDGHFSIDFMINMPTTNNL
ncbi:MAG: hypothetical protein NT004_11150, partial [Bacteroidetes bacterium]|nr:hypothetical protein [Bacteroidota bacterium]